MATEGIDQAPVIAGAAEAEDNKFRAQLAEVEAEIADLHARKVVLIQKAVRLQQLEHAAWKREHERAACRRLETQVAELRSGLGTKRPVSVSRETHANRALTLTERCQAAREKEQTK